MKYVTAAVLIIFLFSGCPPLPPPRPAEMNLVVLGGMDENGYILDEVIYYRLGTYGALSRAGLGRSMGEPRISVTAAAQKGSITALGGYASVDDMGGGAVLHHHGNHLFLIGGMDEEGRYLDRILTRRVGDQQWRETITLPESLGFAFAFSIANRLFVIGGENEEGPSDRIYYTYIHPNGELGFNPIPWSSNPIRLPYGVSRAAAAVHDGRIFLIGGVTPDGVSDRIIHARISPKSSVGQWYESNRLLPEPRSLASAAVVFTDTRDFSIFYEDAEVEGSGHYRDAAGIYAAGRDGELVHIPLPSLEPRVPEVYPGSGLVGRGSTVRFIHDPGTTVEYSRDRSSWSNASGLRIMGNEELWYRTVRGPLRSAELPVSYRTQSLGFMAPISGSVAVDGEVHELVLSERTHWWNFSSPGTPLTFEFFDGLTSEAYDSRVELTIMEGDMYTEVLDRSSNPVSRFTTSDSRPIRLSLQRGTYLIHIRVLSGENMGIRISRD